MGIITESSPLDCILIFLSKPIRVLVVSCSRSSSVWVIEWMARSCFGWAPPKVKKWSLPAPVPITTWLTVFHASNYLPTLITTSSTHARTHTQRYIHIYTSISLDSTKKRAASSRKGRRRKKRVVISARLFSSVSARHWQTDRQTQSPSQVKKSSRSSSSSQVKIVSDWRHESRRRGRKKRRRRKKTSRTHSLPKLATSYQTKAKAKVEQEREEVVCIKKRRRGRGLVALIYVSERPDRRRCSKSNSFLLLLFFPQDCEGSSTWAPLSVCCLFATGGRS